MKKMTLLILLTVSAIFSGCATQRTAEAQRIIETDEATVKSCRLVGESVGSSQYGGLAMQEAGKNYAKNEALNNAVNMKATHVVWKKAEGGFFGGRATALAYDCNNKK